MTRPRNVDVVTVNAKTSASAGNTWRDLPAAQQPDWPDQEALREHTKREGTEEV